MQKLFLILFVSILGILNVEALDNPKTEELKRYLLNELVNSFAINEADNKFIAIHYKPVN